MRLPDPGEAVRPVGPWTHRDVAANGSRFHVAEAGEGPMVVLLHGFPMFWWTWRRQLASLSAAGHRAVAMDLRGYGGSDHPPHGYDPFTLAADVVGVVRSLGESSAVVVGHGIGGLVAWTLATVHPDAVDAAVVVGAAHPQRLREAVVRDRHQRSRVWYSVGFQRPFAPERALTRHDAALVGELLVARSGTTTWPTEEEVAVYRAAMLTPATAHCAVEFHRWALRSLPRRDGRRFTTAMEQPVTVPVLQLQGSRDDVVLASTVDGSQTRVAGPYRRVDLDCGHVPQEEVPEAFDRALLDWLGALG